MNDGETLRLALGQASPGSVIGMDGLIEITSPIDIWISDLTLTCATPGSGIVTAPGSGSYPLLRVWAKDVTIDRLVLSGWHALLANNNGRDRFAEGMHFTRNTINCEGPGNCFLTYGGTETVITDNYLETQGRGGFHLERRRTSDQTFYTDRTRIERNTIVVRAVPPEGNPINSGIRLRDGSDLVIAHNTVLGPFRASIGLSEISESRVEMNRLEDALDYGIWVASNPYTYRSAVGNTFRANRISGAGEVGIQVGYACDNLFLGNSVKVGSAQEGVVFGLYTGSNAWIGDNGVVVDHGDFDCDRDGVSDPNIMTGVNDGSPCVPPPSGLVSWWPGSWDAEDVVGGHDGALEFGASIWAGKVAEAFRLDGVDARVTVPDHPDWTFGDAPFTIDLWVNFTSVAARSPLVDHNEGPGPTNKWVLWYDEWGHDTPAGPALRFHINNTLGEAIDAISAPWEPVPGQWYHVAVTRDGSAYALYIDGVRVATDTEEMTIPDAEIPLSLGQSEEGYFFKGYLDEVEIFNRALGDHEIKAIFDAGAAGKCQE